MNERTPGELEPVGLVIGMHINGLAIARALATRGIEVRAIAESQSVPARWTKYGTVDIVSGINSRRLISVLNEFADTNLAGRRAVLFPTSDNMVRALANGWDELDPCFLLSWAHCRELVLNLLIKDKLQEFSERAGVLYPKSVFIQSSADKELASDTLGYPMLLKPVTPLSGFKSLRLERESELSDAIRNYERDLPFLAQNWIEGEANELFFYTGYYDRGLELASFTGRKLFAIPPALGQGTVMASYEDDSVRDEARKFLSGLDLSGPVSIEFKRAPDGRDWLIEPNVGRTEYCIDLVIQAGLNLPELEFRHVTGQELPVMSREPSKTAIWFDTDRDPLALLRLCWQERRFVPLENQVVFPYFGHRDRKPLVAAVGKRITGKLGGGLRRVGRRLSPFEHKARRAFEGHWQIRDVEALEEYADVWNRINGSNANLPILDAEFFGLLLPLADPREAKLAVCLDRGETVAAAILVPTRLGSWTTFQPSQAPLGAWVQKPSIPLVPALESLRRKLPGPCFVLGATQLDPSIVARPESEPEFTTLDHMDTARLTIKGSFDDYWKNRGKNLRKNLARQRNRLNREGLETRLEISLAPREVGDAVDEYGKLESLGWKAAQGMALHPSDAQGRFYRELMERYAARSEACVWQYFYNDALVASELYLDRDGRLILLKTTRDENQTSTSPSYLLRQEMLKLIFDGKKHEAVEYYGRVMDWHKRWTNDFRALYHANQYSSGLAERIAAAKHKLFPAREMTPRGRAGTLESPP